MPKTHSVLAGEGESVRVCFLERESEREIDRCLQARLHSHRPCSSGSQVEEVCVCVCVCVCARACVLTWMCVCVSSLYPAFLTVVFSLPRYPPGLVGVAPGGIPGAMEGLVPEAQPWGGGGLCAVDINAPHSHQRF